MNEFNQPSPSSLRHSSYLPFTLFLLGIVILVAVLFNILVYLKHSKMNSLDQEIAAAQQQAGSIVSADIRNVRQAQQLVERIKNEAIQWSPVVQELLSTLPANVALASLAGNNEGKITAQLASNDMNTVIRTIELLAESSLFKNTFVPSVSIAQSVENGDLITFPILIDLSKNKVIPRTPVPPRAVPANTNASTPVTTNSNTSGTGSLNANQR